MSVNYSMEDYFHMDNMPERIRAGVIETEARDSFSGSVEYDSYWVDESDISDDGVKYIRSDIVEQQELELIEEFKKIFLSIKREFKNE